MEGNKKIYYRYDANFYANGTMQISCSEYKFLRKTPKGTWIVPNGYNWESLKKWIPDVSKKKYAYDTKEAAWHSFKLRSKRRKQFAESNLIRAKQIMGRIEIMESRELETVGE